MRPELLNPLFVPVTSIPGIGPKMDKLLRFLLGRAETPRIADLLLHLPVSVIDRRARPKIRDAEIGKMVTLEVTVDRHRPAPAGRARAPHLVYASDDTGGSGPHLLGAISGAGLLQHESSASFMWPVSAPCDQLPA